MFWGAFENRCWREAGENWILGHFKTYHLLMFLLFAAVNILDLTVVFTLSGAAFAVNIQNFLIWVWLMLYDTLSLDVVWWYIRNYDKKHMSDADFAKRYGGEGNGWHNAQDWDAWGLPLWLGTYSWWWIFTAVLAVLGVAILAY